MPAELSWHMRLACIYLFCAFNKICQLLVNTYVLLPLTSVLWFACYEAACHTNQASISLQYCITCCSSDKSYEVFQLLVCVRCNVPVKKTKKLATSAHGTNLTIYSARKLRLPPLSTLHGTVKTIQKKGHISLTAYSFFIQHSFS